MKLNCKPGDLAVVVRSKVGNEGRIVRVLRAATYDEAQQEALGYGRPGITPWRRHHDGAWWEVEGNVVIRGHASEYVHPTRYMPDHALRPIRDPGDDAVDETRAWLPSPVKELLI